MNLGGRGWDIDIGEGSRREGIWMKEKCGKVAKIWIKEEGVGREGDMNLGGRGRGGVIELGEGELKLRDIVPGEMVAEVKGYDSRRK